MARQFHMNNDLETDAPSVTETSQDAVTSSSDHSVKKKNTVKLIIIIAVVLFLIIGGVFAFLVFSGSKKGYTEANNGAMLVSVDDSMTDEEIQQMLAEQSTTMKIHVWQAPAINGNVLSLGFENSASNKYDQAFRVIQNDKTIYESYPVKPGDSVKDVECPEARVGRAVVEIFNFVDGTVYGNGVRCEVVIIGSDNDGNKADRVSDVTGVLDDKSDAEATPKDGKSK